MPVIWATLQEDLDPVVIVALFETLSPFNLISLFQFAMQCGLKESYLLNEFEEPETLLKEYVLSIGTSWWTKVLKKNIEAIYKNYIDVCLLSLH